MSYRTGWGYSKEFFNATDTRNFFAGFHNAMEMEVEKMSDSEIVSCNFDEWANYLATKYSVIPISIFETNIERRLTEAKVKRANPFRGAPYERDYFEVDGVRITFIGECKIWHGEQLFQGAIQQVINYSTWRDVKVSVIVFNKENKSFHSILDKIKNWADTSAVSYTQPQANIWHCKYHRQDMNVDIQLTILAFDLYVDKSQFKDARYDR